MLKAVQRGRQLKWVGLGVVMAFTVIGSGCVSVAGGAVFKSMDLNGDGAVTQEEWLSDRAEQEKIQGRTITEEEYLQNFNEADANGDGKVTKKEFLNSN